MRVSLAGLAVMGIFCSCRDLFRLTSNILCHTRIELGKVGAAIFNLCILLSRSKHSLKIFLNGKILGRYEPVFVCYHDSVTLMLTL